MTNRRGLLAPLADHSQAHPILVTIAMTLVGAFVGASIRYLNATGSVSAAELVVWTILGALMFGAASVRSIIRNRRDKTREPSSPAITRP
jgi:hypothetical protein